MLAWHGYDNLSFQGVMLSLDGFMEPAIVDSQATVIRGIEDIGIAVSKTNVAVIVGLAGVDGLRRNNIISGYHDHERSLDRLEVIRIGLIERTCLIENVVERPAQCQPGILVLRQLQFVESSKRLTLHAHDFFEQPQFGGGVAYD